MRKIVKRIGDAWLVLSVTLTLCVFIESSFSLVFRVRDYIGSLSPTIDYRVKSDTYSDISWVHDYYKEFHSANEAKWAPYIYWRRKPFQGKFITINSDGIRLTPKTATIKKEADTLTIFMFGGSTTWGTGVRDGFTIPAMVASELQNKGIAAEIINFGESGYVTTQEVILLLLQLQKGKVPDVVIFYDGVNDIYSAYQQRVAGLPENEFHRVIEFNLSNPDKLGLRIKLAFQDAVRQLSTLRLVKYLLRLSSVIGPESGPVAPSQSAPKSAAETKFLVREVVTTYWSNVEFVTVLAEHYGFRSLFYWQPTIFQKEHLTEYERSERRKEPNLEMFYQNTNDEMKQSTLTQKSEYPFHDLSMVFAEMREPLYIDWAHLGESGNKIIAQKIAKDVFSTIGAGQSAAQQGPASDADSAALRRRR